VPVITQQQQQPMVTQIYRYPALASPRTETGWEVPFLFWRCLSAPIDHMTATWTPEAKGVQNGVQIINALNQSITNQWLTTKVQLLSSAPLM